MCIYETQMEDRKVVCWCEYLIRLFMERLISFPKRQLIQAQGENIVVHSDLSIWQISWLDMIRQKRSWGHIITALVIYRITMEENLRVF